MGIRKAEIRDLEQIKKIEKDYYEGYTCPDEILLDWIENSKTFFVLEEKSGIKAFIFIELLKEKKELPFIHKIGPKGEYAYVSDIGVLDGDEEKLSILIDFALKSLKQIKSVIWVTGSGHKHDKIELGLLKRYGFEKIKKIDSWEAYPGHFVSDHWLYEKKLNKV